MYFEPIGLGSTAAIVQGLLLVYGDEFATYLQLDSLLRLELPTAPRTNQRPELRLLVPDEQLPLLIHERTMTTTHTYVIQDHLRTSIPTH